MQEIVIVDNLSFGFGEGKLYRQVLKNISLAITEGEIVILTGPSGSGKTTLLTMIGGLRAASVGSIQVLRQELVGANESLLISIRRQIGYIFQQYNLIEFLTAVQNVCMPLELRENMDETKRTSLARDILYIVGLGTHLLSKPKELSSGQKQLLSIARALVTDPKLILADEPTASLDKQSGKRAIECLKQLAKEKGSTILLVTHDYRIMDVADRVITLEDGQILDNKYKNNII